MYKITLRFGEDGKVKYLEKDSRFDYIAEGPISIIPGFNEFFKAFQINGDYYLMTKSGRVLAWRQPGKTDSIMETVWQQNDNPIVAIFEDVDAGKVYAFTETKGAVKGQGVYFELGNKNKTYPYSLKSKQLPGVPALMQKALEYHQVVIEENNK